MYVAIYNRVSDDDQSTEGTSLESQAERNAAHAKAHGFTDVRQFNEVHTAAELWERPVLSAIREDIRARKVSALVVYAIDRLTRNVAHLMILQDEAERHGCALIFTTEALDNTPEGKLLASVRGYVAEVERLKIIERTVRGRRQRLQSGKINSDCFDVYGYRRDKAKGVRLVHDEESAIVRDIFARVTSGDSLHSIARHLNATTPSPFDSKGIKKGAAWTIATLQLIIRNEAYKGETYGWKYKGEGKHKRVKRPKEEWIKLPDGVTPAIVTPDEWQAANDALTASVGNKTRNAKKPFLLRGMVFCAVCGEKRWTHTRRGKHHYVCAKLLLSYKGERVAKCESSSTPAAKLEPDVWRKVQEFVADPLIIRALLQHAKDQPAKDDPLAIEAKTARKAIDKLEQSEHRLLKRLREAGDDVARLIMSELQDLQTELTTARQRLTDTEARQAAQAQASHRIQEIADLVSSAMFQGDNVNDFDGKRRALESLKLRVLTNGEEWRIEIQLGSGFNSPGVPVYL